MNLIASLIIALSISSGGACRYETPVIAEDGSVITCPYVYYGEGTYTTIAPTTAPTMAYWRAFYYGVDNDN